MPLIPVIGRKQPKMRLRIGALYLVLGLGAVTMVYPFVVMLGTSITSTVDRNEFRPVPAYLRSDLWLFRKYVAVKYQENISEFNSWLGNEVADFKDLAFPTIVEPPVTRLHVAEWQSFRAGLPIS